jgi:hypothetical protein
LKQIANMSLAYSEEEIKDIWGDFIEGKLLNRVRK